MASAAKKNKHGTLLETAFGYVAAGLSFVPIRRDGSKTPAVPSWKQFQSRLPSESECRLWFDRAEPFGIALIGGSVSGGLEILDFDAEAETIFPAWREAVDDSHPGLFERLRIVQTPGNGFHVLYRCPDEDIHGNTKLAFDPNAKAVLIETRGGGGYALTVGSPPECHASGKPYLALSGPDLPPSLTPDERDTLLSLARSFDRRIDKPTRTVGADLRPGDVFEQRADWPSILEPHGWRCVHTGSDGERRWRRPGKETGWSATTGKCRAADGADLLRVFSSNAAPFEDGRAYGKFRAYALLNHSGDLSAAAEELARKEYGSPRANSKKTRKSTATAPPTEPKPPREPAHLRCTYAADIAPTPLAWLVPDIIPLGKLVLLAGEGGLGKSTITLDLAARLSRGECAFGLDYPAMTGETLAASCEDDPADTVVPRLMAAGADLRRVHFLNGVGDADKAAPWSLAHHEALTTYLATHANIRLVMIDPASAFAGRAGIDGHKDAELRALLGPLADVAAARRVTVLLISHLGKRDCARAVQRVMGSVGWVNAVRSAWVVTPREGDPSTRLMLPLKSNLSPRQVGLTYQLSPLSGLEQDEALAGVSGLGDEDRERLAQQLFRVRWTGETTEDADSVFAAMAQRNNKGGDADKAADWLRERLADGPVSSETCVSEGNEALGIDRNRHWWRRGPLEKIGGHTRKTRFDGGWEWSVSSSSSSTPSTPSTPSSISRGFCEGDEGVEGVEGVEGDTRYTAPDADPRDLETPFERNGQPH